MRAGLALCKTIESFLNANAAQWTAMENSGSTPSLDVITTTEVVPIHHMNLQAVRISGATGTSSIGGSERT